jgi:hypothetical protein
MVKKCGSMRLGIEKMKNTIICGLFYEVALDIISPMLETKFGNKYVLVVIDDYFKWCETKLVKEHTTTTITRLF